MRISSYFEFYQHTDIRSGIGTRLIVPSLVKDLGGSRPVLFTDKGITQAGLTEQLEAVFKRLPGIQLAGVFDDISQDTKSGDVNKAIQYFKEVNGDTLIALGGGSVLDAVKVVKWSIDNKVNDVSTVLTGNILETLTESKRFTTPHIALPTTAGTGSEVSPGAVIYNEALGTKCNLLSAYIGADVAVIDPELTVGLPPFITAFTGMDALIHAVEGYFSPRSNAMSDALALHAIRLIRDNLSKAVHDGHDIIARTNMLHASTQSITSFVAVGGPYPVHNMAHAYGSKFGIPHGLANAVLFSPVMRAMSEMYLSKVNEFAEALKIDVGSKKPEQLLEECIKYIEELRNDIELPSDFEKYNITESQIPEIIMAVQNDPLGRIAPLPVPVVEAVAKQLISQESVKA